LSERARTHARIVIVFAALSAVYALVVWRACGGAGFPLDDAFIHLQFARNLFEGGQMAFNPGTPSSGSTAPGYVALLAAVYALVHDWYAASYVLGAAASLATALLGAAILRDWTGREDVARTGGVLIAVMHPTVVQAYAGMEAPLYSLVFLAGLRAYGRGGAAGRLAGTAVFAAAIWARPEMMLAAGLVALERLVAVRRAGEPLRAAVREIAAHAAIAVAVLGGYCAFHWHLDRHLVPSTFAAKATAHYGGTVPAWLDGLPAALAHRRWGGALVAVTLWPAMVLASAVVGLAVGCAPLVAALPVGLRGAARGDGSSGADAARRLAAFVLVAFPLVRGAVDPVGVFGYQLQRYFAHLTPVAVLLVAPLLHEAPATGRRPRRVRAWIGAALAGTVAQGAIAVLSVSNIQTMQVGMAEWIAGHTGAGALVATNDIGAIGFVARRPILDLIGLIEPAVVRHRLAGGSTLAYLDRRAPALVVVFPGWFPDVAASPEYERVFSIRISPNVACGGSELVAYRRHGS
jgi:hypothetical protein